MIVTPGDVMLEDILLHPGEDWRRLVFADWLDENGDERRAKWIRVGVWLRHPIYHAPGCQTPWKCQHSELNRGREPGGSGWIWYKGFVGAVVVDSLEGITQCGRFVYFENPTDGVIFLGKKPLAMVVDGNDDSAPTRFGWHAMPENSSFALQSGSSVLPMAIFDRLLPDDAIVQATHGNLLSGRSYASEYDAITGLSRACLRYGRKVAGCASVTGK